MLAYAVSQLGLVVAVAQPHDMLGRRFGQGGIRWRGRAGDVGNGNVGDGWGLVLRNSRAGLHGALPFPQSAESEGGRRQTPSSTLCGVRVASRQLCSSSGRLGPHLRMGLHFDPRPHSDQEGTQQHTDARRGRHCVGDGCRKAIRGVQRAPTFHERRARNRRHPPGQPTSAA